MICDDYQLPCCRHGEGTLRALYSSQYTHMSLSVMSKLLLEAVQSATFNAWFGFTGDRIYRRRRMLWILRHPAPPQRPLKLPAAAAKETSDREVADLRQPGFASTLHSDGRPPGIRAAGEALMVLCGNQHSYLPLSFMKELLKDAVQSLAFNAWVDFQAAVASLHTS